MLRGVRVHDDGRLAAVQLRRRRDGLALGEQPLRAVAEVGDLRVLSTRAPRELLEGHALDFELPPPFDHLYPTPMLIVGTDARGAPAPLECDAVERLCRQHARACATIRADVNVYDVPVSTVEPAPDDEPSDDDEDKAETDEDDDDKELHDDDDDWEPEDDELAPPKA